MRAGLRIGDGRHVDLLHYVAWLLQFRHAPKPTPTKEGRGIERRVGHGVITPDNDTTKGSDG